MYPRITDFQPDNGFPTGYMAHYVTFPSINDQKFSRHWETLLFRGIVRAFTRALILIMITSILISIGRH